MTFRFIKVPEHAESGFSPPSYTTNWKAVGSGDLGYVQSYAIAATPAIIASPQGTLFRQDVRIRQVAYNHFSVQVPYGPRQNESGEWSWDFDTTGGTVHITNAKEEVARYPDGEAPNQFGAIAVDGDNAQGVDIVIPAMRIGVSYKHPEGTVTLAHAKFLNSVTGSVNSDSFLTFDPGEVLFLGARGSDGTEAEATVSYQFAISANATGLSIGTIAGIEKRGHDLLWIRYEDAEETAGGESRPIRKPKFVYVDRVYQQVALATALGFGGA